MVEGFDVGLEMSGSAASALNQMIGNMRNGGAIARSVFGDKQPTLDMDEIILKV